VAFARTNFRERERWRVDALPAEATSTTARYRPARCNVTAQETQIIVLPIFRGLCAHVSALTPDAVHALDSIVATFEHGNCRFRTRRPQSCLVVVLAVGITLDCFAMAKLSELFDTK
jgi:hypothetical protein